MSDQTEAAPYTPTTQQVKDVYHNGVLNVPAEVDVPRALAMFDRWLAQHDAEVQKAERELVATQIRRNCTIDWEISKAGGDALIYAVADWVRDTPEWVSRNV